MTVRRLGVGPEAVAEAVRIVKRGGVVAIPTDTVYGLGCDPSSDQAVEALFKVKNRQAKPVPVLCADSGVAEKIVELNSVARKLAGLHWPGALTIVAPLKKGSKLSPLLHQGSGYLGVRVPDSEVCRELARKVGGAITGTSANLSGQPVVPHRRPGGRLARREGTAGIRRRHAPGEGVDRRQRLGGHCRGFKGGFGQDSGG